MKQGILIALCVSLVMLAGARVSFGTAEARPPDAGFAPAAAPAREREALRAGIEAALAQKPLSESRTGVCVRSVETGELVFAHNADELLNPASNVKLVTAAAALARLGPEYRFGTEFSCSAPVKKGFCPTLWIKGRGDPVLYTERIHGIAAELAHRGLKRVGDIAVDDTWFDEEREGPGWDQERSDKAYLAPAGALSVNHNAVGIYVTPGETERAKARVEVEPASDYFKIENRVVTVSRRSRQRVQPASVADGPRQRVVVSGRVRAGGGTLVFYRRVDNPPAYAGETFKAILKRHGVEVKGKVRQGAVPADAQLFYVSWSPSLAEIVRELDKVSNNFIGEQLLKTLGAEVKGPPGSWANGVEVVEAWLAELGLARGSYVMKNGSGLNDTNRFSAAQLVHLLAAVHDRTHFYPEYAASLGIAARDGTVRLRMEGTAAAGKLRAKTGTLENASSLSGYVRTPGGELLAYSVLVNDYPGRMGPVVAGIDRVAEVIAGGGYQPPAPAAVAGVPPPAPDELEARVTTYSGLAKMADRRNLPFLRSALRTEADPVLRAVLADAVYQSDPDSGETLLLENVPASPDVFGRLRSVASQLSIPVPVLGALIDLAADGSAEALDKLLPLAGQAGGDQGVEATLADGLQEIGRTAPAELSEALRRAPPETSARVLPLLAQGIAAADEKPEHPFLSSLKECADGRPVPAAMALYDDLQKALGEIANAAACEGPGCEHRAAPAAHVETPGGGGDGGG